MLSATIPAISAETAFKTCSLRSRDPGLAARLAKELPAIGPASALFEDAVQQLDVTALAVSSFKSTVVTDEEFIRLYDRRMARKGAPGRRIYDELLLACDGRCPFCGHRDATTLDHYLPKSKFPRLAVAPLNLVPACAVCNHAKSEEMPAAPEDAYLHPYFDRIDQDVWLMADVLETSPGVAIFSVAPPNTWSALTQKRVQHQFDNLGLGRLFALHAAAEIRSVASYLADLYTADGEEALKNHLGEVANSRSKAARNGWQTALYRGLAGSSWFVGGGVCSLP